MPLSLLPFISEFIFLTFHSLAYHYNALLSSSVASFMTPQRPRQSRTMGPRASQCVTLSHLANLAQPVHPPQGVFRYNVSTFAPRNPQSIVPSSATIPRSSASSRRSCSHPTAGARAAPAAAPHARLPASYAWYASRWPDASATTQMGCIRSTNTTGCILWPFIDARFIRPEINSPSCFHHTCTSTVFPALSIFIRNGWLYCLYYCRTRAINLYFWLKWF